MNPPREDVLQWDEFYMMSAALVSYRSKDPITCVGSVIVDDDSNLIVSMGYNGLTVGVDNHSGHWGKNQSDAMHNKCNFVVHSEANAIINVIKTGVPTNATMYITHHPCLGCTRLICQTGIKRVVYGQAKGSDEDNAMSEYMFEAAGITIRQYDKRMTIEVKI